MAEFCIITGLLGVLFGLANLIKPIAFLGLRKRHQAGWIILAAFGVMLAGGQFVSGERRRTAENGRRAVAVMAETKQTAATPAANTAAPVRPPLPNDETAFLEVVEKARSEFLAANNELAAGGVRASRKTALCALLASFAVRDWFGTVLRLESNSEGKGVLSISIGKNVHLATHNNALTDFGENTLIEPGSAVFAVAARLKAGDSVRFSGSFVEGDTDCIDEQSWSLRGAVLEPAFTFRFEEIAKQ